MIIAPISSGYKVLDTIGDTVIVSMQQEVYDRYFHDAQSWESIIDNGSNGISASLLLEQLQR